jgi:N-acetylglucosamine-6-phosphate deacetylase
VTAIAAAGALTLRGASADSPCWLRFDDAHIAGGGTGAAPGAVEDLGAVVLVPGFVDLQVNGAGAVDFADADRASAWSALAEMARHGVTACLPTIVSRPLDAYDAPLDVLTSLRDDAPAGGAVALGAHLEGPFLGGRPGAHDLASIRDADVEWLAALLDARPGLVRLVTLAPEADPDFRATRLLCERGVVVSVGHSAASYAHVVAAADAGATMATHVFNGMSSLHHREPGVVGAALDRLVPSVIADLVHVHPAVLRLVARSTDRAVIVTDQIGGSGLEPAGGAYRLANGTLAGSATSMDTAFRNLVDAGVTLERAVSMASTTPAELLGDTSRGRLEPGRRADVVALDRDTFEVRGVWLAGRRIA